jgi:hypothetical protein
LTIKLGFVGKRPTESGFRAELERETAGLEEFLGLSSGQRRRR